MGLANKAMVAAGCACLMLSACASLPTTEAVSSTVLAERKFNPVAHVTTGRAYTIEASGTWCDWKQRADATGYSGHGFMRLVERWRRHPKAAWFALVGVVVRPDARSGRAAIVEGPVDLSLYLDGSRPWVPASSGILHVFANDLGVMYFNNRGAITVDVRPVEAAR